MQGKWVAYCMKYEGSNNGSSERDQMTGQAKRVCESLAKPQKAGMPLSKASWIWAACESLAANDRIKMYLCSMYPPKLATYMWKQQSTTRVSS